jgi:hypothetical protein
MSRHILGLLLSAALITPQTGWAASSKDYAGPCANESTAPGTPQFISVDVRTRPTDARVINLTAPGRLRLGISCVYTEFKVTRLGDGQVVFQHRCNKHGFGWYDAANLPAGSYRATAEAKRISFEGYTPVQGHGTMDTYAYVGNGGAYQPVNCSPQGSPPRRVQRRCLHRQPPRSIATRRASTWPSTRAFAPRTPGRRASRCNRMAIWWFTTNGEHRDGRPTRLADRVASPRFRAMAISWSTPRAGNRSGPATPLPAIPRT